MSGAGGGSAEGPSTPGAVQIRVATKFALALLLLAAGCAVDPGEARLELYRIDDLVDSGGSSFGCVFGEREGEELPAGSVGGWAWSQRAIDATGRRDWEAHRDWCAVVQNSLFIVRAPESKHSAVRTYIRAYRKQFTGMDADPEQFNK